MFTIGDLSELREIIEKLRGMMYEIAQGKTLTDPEVVRVSQMLDVMLNEYQRMLNEKINK